MALGCLIFYMQVHMDILSHAMGLQKDLFPHQ